MLCLMGAAGAVDYPPLCVEISSEHPLLIFQKAAPDSGEATAYAQQVILAWNDLPHELQPYAVMQIDLPGTDLALRHEQFRSVLTALQQADVPAVVRLADADPRRIYPLASAEELIRDFTCIKGVQVVGMTFNEYYAFGRGDVLGIPANVRWLVDAIEIAARYGRFIAMEFGEVSWPRIMANAWCKPLYDKIRACAAYTVPINARRGPHDITNSTALMGLWLEDSTAQWGVAATSWWYSDAHFLEPGVFGLSDTPGKMPPSLYRAMILDGAMTGAAVYSFSPESDLWFGAAQHHWHEAIYPTLIEVLDRSLIARKDFVQKKTKVAYQIAAAETPEEFHLSLRDIDPIFDKGFLLRGAYGMERPGQTPELIPNTGRHYWVPLLSPHASNEVMGRFAMVLGPGEVSSAEAWTELLDRYYDPDGEGSAFITRVGRGVFVMNSRENTFERQPFRIPAIPAPVRKFEARHTDNGVELSWPFREGDVAYKVYKRVLPSTSLTLIANGVDGRHYLDADAPTDATIAYAVTALTNETEPYEDALDYGEYLTFSVVESRVAEEAVITPLLGFALSQPLADTVPPSPPAQAAWPNLDSVPEALRPTAQAVADRIDALDLAFREENLKGVLDVYSTEYADPQAWPFDYVRRAYQWFFERYNICTMARQIRRWDFTSYETARQVDVLLYCRFEGVAYTDPAGRFADLPAYFPRTKDSEIWISFTDKEGPWRILRTNPALPNFRDILTFSAGPADNLVPGPDLMP